MSDEKKLPVELALEASERRFRAIFDSAYQLQLLLDLEGTILEANRAAESLAGTAGATLRGRLLWEAFPWDTESSTVRQVRESFDRACTGLSSRFEATLASGAEGSRPRSSTSPSSRSSAPTAASCKCWPKVATRPTGGGRRCRCGRSVH